MKKYLYGVLVAFGIFFLLGADKNIEASDFEEDPGPMSEVVAE